MTWSIYARACLDTYAMARCQHESFHTLTQKVFFKQIVFACLRSSEQRSISKVIEMWVGSDS
jgi:hypothetical protein